MNDPHASSSEVISVDIAVSWCATASEDGTAARMAGVCGLARTNYRRGDAQLHICAARGARLRRAVDSGVSAGPAGLKARAGAEAGPESHAADLRSELGFYQDDIPRGTCV